LMIPMQYEYRRHCVSVLGWQDPRGLDDNGEKLPEDEIEEREGTLMWPERFGAREVARIKAELGPYFSSGRLQQSPVPDKGGIFKRDWWQPYDSPDGKFPPMDHIIVSVDGAFTEREENCPSACTVWGCWDRDEREIPKIMLMSAWRKWLPFSGPLIEKSVDETVVQYQRRTQEFKPWSVIANPVRGDKVARALAAQPTFAQQLVYAPDRDWADMVITEMSTFPKSKYDDLTDSTTQAINFLRTAGRAPSREEWAANKAMEGSRRRPRPTALYPC